MLKSYDLKYLKRVVGSWKEAHQKHVESCYKPSHPWYYVLGGQTLNPKQIFKEASDSGYKGYRAEDIGKIKLLREPERSERALKLKTEVLKELFQNVSRYRELAFELHKDRLDHGLIFEECKEIHTSISLKHNHIYNDGAHLSSLGEILLTRQPELFD